jgi:hypothetical protein
LIEAAAFYFIVVAIKQSAMKEQNNITIINTKSYDKKG